MQFFKWKFSITDNISGKTRVLKGLFDIDKIGSANGLHVWCHQAMRLYMRQIWLYIVPTPQRFDINGVNEQTFKRRPANLSFVTWR